jgi:ankyrin repeat protein
MKIKILPDLPYEVEKNIFMYLDAYFIQELTEDSVLPYVWKRMGRFLPEAAKCGNLTGVMYLIINKISDVIKYNSESSEYKYALMLAAEYGHFEIVKYMAENAIEHDIDLRVFCQPLIASVSNNHLEIFKYLIKEHGSDVHVNNDCIFIQCALIGHLEMIKYLVEEHNIDLNNNNDFILLQCEINGHSDIIKYLLEKNARTSIDYSMPLFYEFENII